MRVILMMFIAAFSLQLGFGQTAKIEYRDGKLVQTNELYEIKDFYIGKQFASDESIAYSSLLEAKEDERKTRIRLRVSSGAAVLFGIGYINAVNNAKRRVFNFGAVFPFSATVISGSIALYYLLTYNNKIIKSKKAIKNFVDVYNNNRTQKDTGAQLRLGTTPNGAGIVLQF